MNPKVWWNHMSVEDRTKILDQIKMTEYADKIWENLPKFLQTSLETWHSKHLGTVNIEVQSWIKKDDSRPKKKYCQCGALLRPNGVCWRCSGLAEIKK